MTPWVSSNRRERLPSALHQQLVHWRRRSSSGEIRRMAHFRSSGRPAATPNSSDRLHATRILKPSNGSEPPAVPAALGASPPEAAQKFYGGISAGPDFAGDALPRDMSCKLNCGDRRFGRWSIESEGTIREAGVGSNRRPQARPGARRRRCSPARGPRRWAAESRQPAQGRSRPPRQGEPSSTRVSCFDASCFVALALHGAARRE